jgi:hypothetical protein
VLSGGGGYSHDSNVPNDAYNRTLFTEKIPQNFRMHELILGDNEVVKKKKQLPTQWPTQRPTQFPTQKVDISQSKREIFKKYRKVNSYRDSFYVTKENIVNYSTTSLGSFNFSDDILSNFYVSANESVHFEGENGAIVGFMLSRIKYNFIIYYKSTDGKYGFFNAPSEIVDLSMSKQFSYDLLASFKNDGVKKKLNTYKYIYLARTPNELDVVFHGLSIYGFINDLMKMLFIEVEYPWKADKSKKRIYRLIFFIILDLMTRNEMHLISDIIKCLNTVNVSRQDNISYYNNVMSKLRHNGTGEFMEIYNTKINIKYYDNKIDPTNMPPYITTMKLFIDVLSQFTLQKSEDTLNISKGEDGAIRIHNLGGGSYKKYNKYLNKLQNLYNSIY